MRRKRKEEEELAACTFTPQTKWQLAKERRQVASEFKEVTAKAPKLTVSAVIAGMP